MGALVERHRGLWAFYVQDELLTPIGMADSALLLQELPRGAEVAVGHHPRGGEYQPVDQHDIIELASGNLYASAPDIAEFMKFVFRDGEVEGGRILEADTMWSMYDVAWERPRDPRPMGLGWFVSHARLPEPMVHHTGTIQGTESMLALLPGSRIGVFVVANGSGFADLYGELVVEALELLLETTTGDKPVELVEEPKTPVDAEVLDRYQGTWVCGDEVVEVFRRGGKLRVQYGGVSLRLVPTAEARFRVEHWLADPGHLVVEFFVDDPEAEDLMVVHIEELEHTICPRYPEVDHIPPLWEDITGHYRVVPRVESEWFDGDHLGDLDAVIDGGVLRLGGLVVWPESERELRVVGGQWDGETVLRDERTGELTFQHEVDVPTDR